MIHCNLHGFNIGIQGDSCWHCHGIHNDPSEGGWTAEELLENFKNNPPVIVKEAMSSIACMIVDVQPLRKPTHSLFSLKNLGPSIIRLPPQRGCFDFKDYDSWLARFK